METTRFSPIEILERDYLFNPDGYLPAPPDPGFEILYQGRINGGGTENSSQ